jgi:hypothetical protein
MKEVVKIIIYFQWLARFLRCSQTFLIYPKRFAPETTHHGNGGAEATHAVRMLPPQSNPSYSSERCLWLLTQSQTSMYMRSAGHQTLEGSMR